MNTTHTPGPWRISSIGSYGLTIGDEKQIIGTVHGDNSESIANARLIAAAPDLLEALEYAAELIKTARRYFPKSIKNSDRFQLENACASIGKAIHHATT